MAFKFEDLHVWHRAMDLNDSINQLSKTFPKDELYMLTAQMKRASDSVVLNIAEGSTGQSNAVFQQFLGYSLRSLIEVVSCLFIAKRRNYIDCENFSQLYNQHDMLCKMITKLRDSLNK